MSSCVPNNLRGMTNKLLALFLKCGSCFVFYPDSAEEESLCVLLPATKGLGIVMLIITRHGGNMGRRGWYIFPGVRAFGNSMVGPSGTKALVYGTTLQERFSQFLCSCEVVSRGVLYKAGWLLTADMFGFELWKKKKPHWNVELGKDSRCPQWKSPLYIRCLGSFWKLLTKPEYFSTKFALSHFSCFSSKYLNFPLLYLTARLQTIQ